MFYKGNVNAACALMYRWLVCIPLCLLPQGKACRGRLERVTMVEGGKGWNIYLFSAFMDIYSGGRRVECCKYYIYV